MQNRVFGKVHIVPHRMSYERFIFDFGELLAIVSAQPFDIAILGGYFMRSATVQVATYESEARPECRISISQCDGVFRTVPTANDEH